MLGDDVAAFDVVNVIFNFLYQIFINNIAWRGGGNGEGGAILESFHKCLNFYYAIVA